MLAAHLAVILARMAGRPVRLAFTAEESFKSICQPRAEVKIKTCLKKDGTFIARRCEVYLNAGAFVNTTPTVSAKAGYRRPRTVPYSPCP